MRHLPGTAIRLVALVLVITAATARRGAAQGAAGTGSAGSGIALDDSVFQPVRLPSTLAFGYPPNDVHIPRLVELMRQRQFDSLETIYAGLQADVMRDVRH